MTTLYINPAVQSAQLTQPFQAEVRVASDQTWNATQATLSLTNLSLVSVQAGDCGLTFIWTYPTFAAADLGNVETQPCTVETLTLQGNKIGKAVVSLTNGYVVSNGTDILDSMQNGEITITKRK